MKISGIMAFSSNDIKVGSNIEVDGAPWRVIGNFVFFLLLFFWVFELNQKGIDFLLIGYNVLGFNIP